MQVKVLGSAAGGGFPQWNCACPNCRTIRAGKFSGTARTQAQLAWNAAPGQWTLLNASPDLRVQIDATPELWPSTNNGPRHSPIRDVILTGAEVDQSLGLLLLREFHRFRVHATPSVRKILTEDNSIFGVLARFAGQVEWHDLPLDRPFTAGGAKLEVLLPPNTGFPGFVTAQRAKELNPVEAAIGLLISPQSTTSSGAGNPACSRLSSRQLAFLPSTGSISDALLERLQACDVLLFDGTFWSDDEPSRIPGITRTARQMGHLPISGEHGSLQRFSALTRPRKIFIHINNTNPILDDTSPERRITTDSGWEVAWDGMEIPL
jgi:pyrroloquinoline quinone biosynthesis protein B